MYEDKIKKGFFKKFGDYFKIVQEQEKIEKETGLDWDELIESNEKYADLDMRLDMLRDEMNSLLVRTKYFPLVGLTDTGNKVLDIWKEGFTSAKNIEERHIEEYLDEILENLKDDMKERSKQLEPLHLTAQMHSRIYHLYRQVIRCYIYGAFEASCVLCRAITETMIRRFIEYKGYEHLLVGKNKRDKTMNMQDICLNVLGMDKSIIAFYTKIGNKADNVLHANDTATEEYSIKVIKLLQGFIEKFPSQK